MVTNSVKTLKMVHIKKKILKKVKQIKNSKTLKLVLSSRM